MNLCGIDPSLSSTGLVALSEDGTILDQLLIKTKKMRGMPRLKYIRDQLEDFLKRNNIEAVCIEAYAFGVRRSKALVGLGELGGVIRLFLYTSSIPYFDVSPGTLKKFVTGKGNAEKFEVIDAVNQLWGIDFGDKHDLADAYGLARIAIEKFLNKKEITTTKKKKNNKSFNFI